MSANEVRVPMTLERLAELSGLSVRTLDRAVKAGHLKAVNPRMGDGDQRLSKVLVDPDEFARWAMDGAA